MQEISPYLRFPVKIFEVRDAATFIPVMAVRLLVRAKNQRATMLITALKELSPNVHIVEDNAEEYLLRRAGYNREQVNDHAGQLEPYVLLAKLDGVEAQYDPFSWRNQRTMGNAHQYILMHWNELVSGQVIDVEHILGETEKPKQSERITSPY